MKRILFFALFALVTLNIAAQQSATGDAYYAEVKQLFKQTNVKENFAAGVRVMLENIKKNGSLPADFNIDTAVKEIADAVSPLLQDDYVAIYKRYFSLAELREINAFYATPVGKKLTSKTAVITAESASLMDKYAPQVTEILQRHLPKK